MTRAFAPVWAVSAAASVAFAGAVRIDGLAAKVNEQSIMLSEVTPIVEAQRPKLEKSLTGEELKTELRKLYRETLNLLIDRQLILDLYEEQSKGQGKKIPEQFIDERMKAIVQDRFHGDRERMMAALQKEGLTYDDWRKEIKDMIIVTSMRKANVDQNVRISPEALRETYERNRERYKAPATVRLRMIVVEKEDSDEETAEKKAAIEEALAKLKTGGDFAEIAKKVSEDGKAESGGDWGWLDPRKTLRPELAEAILSLAAGETSDILETRGEFYVLKVEERRDESALAFEDVLPQVERDMRQEETKRLYDAWIERLKTNASIAILDVCPY